MTVMRRACGECVRLSYGMISECDGNPHDMNFHMPYAPAGDSLTYSLSGSVDQFLFAIDVSKCFALCVSAWFWNAQ